MQYGFFVYNTINTHYLLIKYLCKYKKLYQRDKRYISLYWFSMFIVINYDYIMFDAISK